MILTFPSSPAVGDYHTYNSRVWRWNGTVWELVQPVQFAKVGSYVETITPNREGHARLLAGPVPIIVALLLSAVCAFGQATVSKVMVDVKMSDNTFQERQLTPVNNYVIGFDGTGQLVVKADSGGGGGGSGDVVGPASSVNNRVVFFDGTTGKLIKDSGLTLSGTNTGDQTISLTGDVTGSGTGSFATTIANDSVTFAKMQHISGTHLVGRHAGGTGSMQEVGVGNGLEFQGSGIRRSALTGDVTASAGSNTTSIANDVVTYAKIQNVSAASKLLGRGSAAGAGDAEEITLGTGLSMSGTTLSAAASSGSMVLLATATASNSAEINFDNEFDPSLYSQYRLVITNCLSASNTFPRLTWRNSTPADITGTYRYVGYMGLLSAAGSSQQANQSNPDAFPLCGLTGVMGSNREFSLVADIIIGDDHQNLFWRCVYKTSIGTLGSYDGLGSLETTTDVLGIKFSMNAGNITSGSIQLYGILK